MTNTTRLCYFVVYKALRKTLRSCLTDESGDD
jgi:hypothetical protein